MTMRSRIAILACAVLLAGTAAAAAQTRLGHRTGPVYHHVYPGVTNGDAWTLAPSELRPDDPPGSRFQDRGIRMGNEMRAIR
jgi:hypothetical protein